MPDTTKSKTTKSETTKSETTKPKNTIVHSTLPTTSLEVTVKGATKSIAVERRGDGSIAFTDKHGVKFVSQYNYELTQFFKMLAELV